MPGGRELEKRANKLNLKKRLNKEALILQIPVPIIMTKNGIVPKQSTVDFAGLIKGGKFIAFDAKETKVKTRFDLSNIHQHQLEYLMMVRELGGLAFFLIWFKSLYNEDAFIVPISVVEHFWFVSERKSIPFEDLKKHSKLVKVDSYLDFLDDEKFLKDLFNEQIHGST